MGLVPLAPWARGPRLDVPAEITIREKVIRDCMREDDMKKQRGERVSLAEMQRAAAKLGGRCLSNEYVTLRTPMRWRCARGHEWEAQGQNVRRGHWCLRCSGKMRKTIEDMQELARSRGGLCLSPVYKNMSTKLTWRCAEGHRWKARPHLIQLGQWCPKCANKRLAQAMLGNCRGKRATGGKMPKRGDGAVGASRSRD
jgi:hypothetical protein